MPRTLKLMYSFTILKDHRVIDMYKGRNFSGGGGGEDLRKVLLRLCCPPAIPNIAQKNSLNLGTCQKLVGGRGGVETERGSQLFTTRGHEKWAVKRERVMQI